MAVSRFRLSLFSRWEFLQKVFVLLRDLLLHVVLQPLHLCIDDRFDFTWAFGHVFLFLKDCFHFFGRKVLLKPCYFWEFGFSTFFQAGKSWLCLLMGEHGFGSERQLFFGCHAKTVHVEMSKQAIKRIQIHFFQLVQSQYRRWVGWTVHCVPKQECFEVLKALVFTQWYFSFNQLSQDIVK